MTRNMNRFLRSGTGMIAILAVVILVLAGALWFGVGPGAGTVLINDADAKCLPNCDVTDSRMLVLAGTGLETLAGDTIYVTLQSPDTDNSLQFGVFDGDTSANWDYPFAAGQIGAPSEFTLFADPNGDGTGTFQVGQWMGNTMANNGWSDFEVSNVDEALNGSYYTYRLQVRNTDPTAINQNAFKLRTTGLTMALSKDNAFGFIAAIWSLPDAQAVYPNWPSRDVTTYDGTFKFYMDVPEPVTELVVWDGDFDHGTLDCNVADTDDPDTPNDPFQPDWAENTAARPEEVAQTTLAACSNGLVPTGSPPEDNFQAPLYLRTPAVGYTLAAPDGTTYTNDQPSGNREWERFSIGSGTPQEVDVPLATETLLPDGIYEIEVSGLDMANLNAWRLDYDIVCVDANGNACEPVCIENCGCE